MPECELARPFVYLQSQGVQELNRTAKIDCTGFRLRGVCCTHKTGPQQRKRRTHRDAGPTTLCNEVQPWTFYHRGKIREYFVHATTDQPVPHFDTRTLRRGLVHGTARDGTEHRTISRTGCEKTMIGFMFSYLN